MPEEPLGILDALENAGQVGGLVNPGDKVVLTAGFQLVKGTREGRLQLVAETQPGWHVYSVTQQEGGPQRSRISVPVTVDVELTGDFVADPPPEVKHYEFFKVPVEEHSGLVTWTAPIRFSEGVVPRDLVIGIEYSGQVCTDAGSCIPISGRKVEARFLGEVEQLAAVPDTAAKASPVAEQGPATAVAGKLDLDRLESSAEQGDGSPMAIVLLTAFAAGFILNFMPCVLPVIGLKVMSFVQQAGDSRGRILALNIWYSLGLMTVFMMLATLAVTIGLGWGQQFSSAAFNVVLSSVVFVFALSFLGVWEIPIPGFVGSGDVQSLADREGPAGAFAKGILTTVLATPCSGPMLTPALTWAVSQSPLVTYAGFACVGLGMASPYLLIGMFPQLVSFLPKPGAWMDTFKHVMGFVLMGTVVFLLTFMPIPYVVPTVALLVGFWAAFWWIGRVPLTEPFQVRLRAWLFGAALSCVVGMMAFGWLLPIMESRFQGAVDRELAARKVAVAPGQASEDELPWQPFSLDLLQQSTAAGHTVLVDFTADW
jgi:thiol:disulfide interchange protein DsbD